MDPVEQGIGALERTRVRQRTLDQQGRGIFLARRAVQAFDNHITEARVVELVLELLAGNSGGDELTRLFVSLIEVATTARAGERHTTAAFDCDVADRRGMNSVREHPIREVQADELPGLQRRKFQMQPTGEIGAEVDLVAPVRQRGDLLGGDALTDAIERADEVDGRPLRRRGFHGIRP